MSHLARYYGRPRLSPVSRKRSGAWPKPKERRLELSPRHTVVPAGDWGGIQAAQCEASAGIPADNAAAIALLESWLKMPSIENEFSQSIRKRIDENRLSDRKFFS
jgi:hypothetical protein